MVEMSHLNIKTKDAHRLARQLADVTGESMSEAVTKAIRERLDRVRGTRTGMADRLLKIGKEFARDLEEPYKSIDHGDLLYDEKGLPK